MATFEKISYADWPNCYRLANGIVELIVTGDVGPRIIRFGFVGESNEFAEYADSLGKTGGDEWRIYGGHRLWHAPEVMPRTYYPDNQPVTIQQQSDLVRVIQPVETTTGIEKQLDLSLSPDKAEVTVVHRLCNHNLWDVELAPWPSSVLAPGGTAIVPLPPRGLHDEFLLPTHSIAFWAYTNMGDPRWTWGFKYILLRQDPGATTPQKIGVMTPDGWAAYARNGHLFVKTFIHVPGAAYADFGSSVEVFTNEDMLEVETLGPMAKLAPQDVVEHVERWYLFRDVPAPRNDFDVEMQVLPKVQEAKAKQR